MTVMAEVKPFRAVDVARVRFLSIAEATRLINACDLEFRPLVRAALDRVGVLWVHLRRKLLLVVDRLGREEVQLERFLVAVAKFREAFAVRFRPLIAGPQ